MTDIVFVQMPFWGIGAPSLGAALLKSFLKERGVESKILDINIHSYLLRGKKYSDYWDGKNGWNHVNSEDEMLAFYKDYQHLFSYYIDEIENIHPKIVGFTVYYSNIMITELFAAELKARCPEVKVIFGGPNVAYYMGNKAELLASSYVDAVCLDEGEQAMLAYYEEVLYESGKALPGVSYKENDAIVDEKPTEYIKKLDTLPFPDFSDFNLSLYGSGVQLPSYVSRGCVNKCIYCTERNFMKLFRFRSAQRVFEEFEHISKTYPTVEYVRMCDSISNANMRMLEEFCDLMIQKKIPLKWNLENAVIRKEMRAPLYKKLKKAGCTLLGYGLETPSERILKDIGKTLAIGVDVEKVLKEGKKAGLYISVNVMFGLPGETEQDYMDLLNFLRKNRRSLSMVNPAINFCVFFPGSFAYHDPAKYGLDITNGPDFWRTLDNKNTFPIRLERFEKFVAEAKALKLDNLFNTSEVPNKNQLLFRYYATVRDQENALKYYDMIPQEDLTSGLIRIHDSLTGNAAIEEYNPIADYCRALKTHSRNSHNIHQSLSWMIDNIRDEEMFSTNDWMKDVHPIKYHIRRLAHKVIGLRQIESRIDSVIALLKVTQIPNSDRNRHQD